MIDRTHELSVTRQAQLLNISRASVYYLPRARSEADLALMRRIDALHLEHPFMGARMLRDALRREGFAVGRKHVATLMARMGVEPLYLRRMKTLDELPIKISDLRGLTRLGVDATVGLMDLVEAMHHTIATGAGIVGPVRADREQGRTRGITGFVYRTVRGTTRLVGHGLDALLDAVTRREGGSESTPQREALIAALNGVWGDHLATSGNPLATPMTLRAAGRPLDLESGTLAAQVSEPSGKLAVLVHGLCMNDLQWTRHGHDHGLALARELGFTPLYLRYNSGLHVSQNGREFADLLERLVAQWPVPVQALVVVGHSMGGLVARSACHQAREAGHAWLAPLRALVFLGTPHHGTPLERGGHLIDMLFGVSPYAAPFARLGKVRSAGITDLRFGNVQDADWQQRDRHVQHADDRVPTPLPEGVDIYLVAATTGERKGGLRDAVIGDGLVPLASALGKHHDAAKTLRVPRSHRCVVTSANHWDLLDRDDVYAQLRGWLAPMGSTR